MFQLKNALSLKTCLQVENNIKKKKNGKYLHNNGSEANGILRHLWMLKLMIIEIFWDIEDAKVLACEQQIKSVPSHEITHFVEKVFFFSSLEYVYVSFIPSFGTIYGK